MHGIAFLLIIAVGVLVPPMMALAVRGDAGWRVLRGLCSAVSIYLGLVAALVLPHHPGSWGRLGGVLRTHAHEGPPGTMLSS